VGELEAAIADLGTLLVRAEKYRRGNESEGTTLRREALALGDSARRLHRRDALDGTAADDLLAQVGALAGRLRALLAAIRHDGDYRAAVAAHAAGDQRALARLLPLIFDGLELVSLPAALFHGVPWRRRGRVRPAAELAADVIRAREEGLLAEGDDLSPGVDPELAAVQLQGTPPAEGPLVLRLLAEAMPTPVYRLSHTGDYLAYAPRLRAPFDVLLATELPPDEVDAAPSDYLRYRGELIATLAAAGVPVETVRVLGEDQ
jgi:hypothetical protein